MEEFLLDRGLMSGVARCLYEDDSGPALGERGGGGTSMVLGVGVMG